MQLPEALRLPPVAQAIAVILGVALAIFRLLTASKAFWSVLPNKLQKAIPALLVAVGLLPTALENAKSWLDVVTALTLIVGAYFTASRGDQSAPKDSDGGPRLDRVNSDPKLTSDDLVDEKTPPSLPGAFRLSALAVLCWLAACSSVPLTSKRCSFDNLEYSAHVATCRREIEDTCLLAEDGTPQKDCPALVRCEAWRVKECS